MAGPGSVVIQFQAKADKAAREVTNLAKKLIGLDDAADDADRGLGKVQDEIDRTGGEARTGATELGKIDTALDSVGDEAEQTAARLRASAGEMAGALRVGSAGIVTEANTMRGQLGEVGKETGAEFVSNIAEGIGSGTASVTDVVQGTLGGITNLAATLTGPLGIAVAGAAAGVGLVFSAVHGEAEKTKEQVNNLITSLKELGTVSGEAAEKVIWEEWLTTMSESPDLLSKIVRGLEAVGIEGELYAKAVSGNVEAQEEVNSLLNDMESDIADAVAAGKPLTEDQAIYLANQDDIRGQLEKQEDVIGRTAKVQDDLAYFQGKGADQAERYTDETGKAEDNSKNILDTINDIPSNKTVTVHVEYEGQAPAGVPPQRPGYGGNAATVAGRAATQVTLNYYAGSSSNPRGDARIIKRILEGEDVRQGRDRAEPLRVAW